MVYYSLYIITLILHVLFMNYVQAGLIYLVFAECGCKSNNPDRLSAATLSGNLRDWMPFALGSAITAGVAPLLFLQMLHQKSFYTANLLLSHRWMILLPVLIAAFYLLYLLKTARFGSLPRIVRAALAMLASACVLFTAFSWTRNHLLSTAAAQWPAYYHHGVPGVFDTEIWMRLGLWIAGSFPTLAVLLAWQLRSRSTEVPPTAEIRRLAMMGLAGLIASLIAVLNYALHSDDLGRLISNSRAGNLVPLLIIILGFVAQLGGWMGTRSSGRFLGWKAASATVGLLLGILGVCLLREQLRLARLGSELSEYPWPKLQSGGFGVFISFFLVNGLMIAWIVRRVGGRRLEPLA